MKSAIYQKDIKSYMYMPNKRAFKYIKQKKTELINRCFHSYLKSWHLFLSNWQKTWLTQEVEELGHTHNFAGSIKLCEHFGKCLTIHLKSKYTATQVGENSIPRYLSKRNEIISPCRNLNINAYSSFIHDISKL
jgi:hypothetical protein